MALVAENKTEALLIGAGFIS